MVELRCLVIGQQYYPHLKAIVQGLLGCDKTPKRIREMSDL